MAAKKKMYNKEETGRLEKICKKLEKVPVNSWEEAACDTSTGRKGFSIAIDKFIFELYGACRPNGIVSATDLWIYSQDEKFSERYNNSSPRLCEIYHKIINREHDEAEKEFNKFLDS